MALCKTFSGIKGRVSEGIRTISSFGPNNEIKPVFVNRNPRNLEKMHIAQKPEGYHLEKPGRTYWNKLVITSTGRHTTARIHHHTAGSIIEASTEEWAIKKHLYRTTDTSAYINLARVLAQRCHEFGINAVWYDVQPKKGGKLEAFLDTFIADGVEITEPEQYKPSRPWDLQRLPKPWESEY